MEDFAVDREHAQTPEGARGRWQGLLRGGACLEKGRGEGRGGDRGRSDVPSRRESGKIAKRIRGDWTRLGIQEGKWRGTTGDKGEGCRSPQRRRGLSWVRAERRGTVRSLAVVHRVAKSTGACALPALRLTSAFLDLKHPLVPATWGRGRRQVSPVRLWRLATQRPFSDS